MIEISKTKLDGVLLIKPSIFRDFRGEYVETYNEGLYKGEGINVRFIQDDIAVSKKNVLRGIHGDDVTWKLVSCLYGEFYLVVVNNDKYSREYGKWESFTLTDKERFQVLIPPSFGNGHLILSEAAIFHYKQSTYYNKALQFTLMWNDPKLGIKWPIYNPILSERDKGKEVVKIQ
jgi:dTDP-4-dehydrorhamnose 3,5-epimerase